MRSSVSSSSCDALDVSELAKDGVSQYPNNEAFFVVETGVVFDKETDFGGDDDDDGIALSLIHI